MSVEPVWSVTIHKRLLERGVMNNKTKNSLFNPCSRANLNEGRTH